MILNRDFSFTSVCLKIPNSAPAGHGNGLQLLGGRELSEMNMHAVAFLYGCESVRLRSAGGQADPMGAHLYLQYAMCPCVVGTLNVTTDVWTDIVALGLSRMWMGDGAGARAGWAAQTRGFGATTKKSRFFEEWVGYKPTVRCLPYIAAAEGMLGAAAPEPELLAVLQRVRCMEEVPLKMRMVLVAQGVPVVADYEAMK